MKRVCKSLKFVSDYTFYCDGCSTKIGEEVSVVEGSNYQQPGYIRIKIEIDGEQHEKEFHLCEQCTERFKELVGC